MAEAAKVPALSGLALGGPPAHLAEQLDQDAGKGLSGSALDNIVPLIYKLHRQSPQATPDHENYIQGAVQGDIWLRNAAEPIVKGAEGILFQPCWIDKDWVEWAPNRGGYVGRHPSKEVTTAEGLVDEPDVEGAREVPDPANPNGRRLWKSAQSNDLVLTRNHVGYVIGRGEAMPYVIPMTGASHTPARSWMTTMRTKRTPGGKEAAIWSCAYRLTTTPKRNQKGSWAEWAIQDAGWFQSKEDLDRGKALHEAFATGEKKAEAPVASEHAGDEAPF